MAACKSLIRRTNPWCWASICGIPTLYFSSQGKTTFVVVEAAMPFYRQAGASTLDLGGTLLLRYEFDLDVDVAGVAIRRKALRLHQVERGLRQRGIGGDRYFGPPPRCPRHPPKPVRSPVWLGRRRWPREIPTTTGWPSLRCRPAHSTASARWERTGLRPACRRR